MRLENKVALVVGSGDRMGRSVPLIFAQEGAKVVVTARRRELIEETVARIKGSGGEATYLQGDATQEDDVRRIVESTVSAYGKLDILYINAGGGYFRQGEGESLVDMSQPYWEQIITNNLRSAYLYSKYGIPEMTRNDGGVIITVAADYTVRQRGTVPYGAAKNGLIGFSQNLAREVRSSNVRVNCICPGLIRIPLREGPIAPRGEKLERMGSPEDIAYAALYLASDEAEWVTGVILPVDGGNEVGLLG